MLRFSKTHSAATGNLPLIALCSMGAGAEVASSAVAFEVAMAASQGAAGQNDVAPPEWIQLTPRGAVTARDNRQFNFNPEKLVAAFKRDGLKLPIDFEHESSFTATLGAKPARSWIVDLEARPEGLFGRVEWLTDAIQALKAKAYRYISPTFHLEADRKTARHMVAAALVASPALGMPALAASETPSNPLGAHPMTMKNLLAKLGLTENATEEEALAKLAALTTPNPVDYVPVAQLSAANSELASLRAEVAAAKVAEETAKCQALIDQGVLDGKITPAAKDHYMNFAKADFAACSAAIIAMPSLVGAGSDKAIDAAAKQDVAGALSPDEMAMASNLGLTSEQFAAAKAL